MHRKSVSKAAAVILALGLAGAAFAQAPPGARAEAAASTGGEASLDHGSLV